MAVACFSEWPRAPKGTSQRVAERVNGRLGGQAPAGGIYHAEEPTDGGGWWAFNVWASAAAFDDFDRQVLQPALRAGGAPPARVRQLPVQWDSSQVAGGARDAPPRTRKREWVLARLRAAPLARDVPKPGAGREPAPRCAEPQAARGRESFKRAPHQG